MSWRLLLLSLLVFMVNLGLFKLLQGLVLRFRRLAAAVAPPEFRFDEQCLIDCPASGVLSYIFIAPADLNTLQLHLLYNPSPHAEAPSLLARSAKAFQAGGLTVVLAERRPDPVSLVFADALTFLADPSKFDFEPMLALASSLWGRDTSARWALVFADAASALARAAPRLHHSLRAEICHNLPFDFIFSKPALTSLFTNPDKSIRLLAINSLAQRPKSQPPD